MMRIILLAVAQNILVDASCVCHNPDKCFPSKKFIGRKFCAVIKTTTCSDRQVTSKGNSYSYDACDNATTTSSKTTTKAAVHPTRSGAPGSSCQGSGVVWEKPEYRCQICSCVQGVVRCNRPRTRARKEIHDLSAEELRKFTTAINTMHENGTFQLFAEMHSQSGPFRHAHGRVSHFLPWHRRFLFEFETLLQSAMGDCSITLPYWNSALAREVTDPLWTASMLGDGGYQNGAKPGSKEVIDRPEKFCVTTGPFGDWQNKSKRAFNRKWFTSKNKNLEKCILRAVGTFYHSSALFRPLDEEKFLDHKKFSDFKNGKDGDRNSVNLAHGLGHAFVGGHMNIPSGLVGLSAYDPMFFLHHANVDRLWEEWQARHNDYTSFDDEYAKVTTTLASLPLGNFTAIGEPERPSTGVTLSVQSVLRSDNLKLLPDDEVSFQVVYTDAVKVLPKKTVLSITNRPGGNRVLRSRRLSKQSATGTRNGYKVQDEDEADDSVPEAPRLEITLKTAICIAKTVRDNDIEKFKLLSPTYDPKEACQSQLEVLKHMTEMRIHMGESEPLDKEEVHEIADFEHTAEELPDIPVKPSSSKIEELIGFKVDEMSDVYFDLIYGNNGAARTDTCLTNACGRICEAETTTTKKKFGGDCRFYCQCERDEAKTEVLTSCGVGEIFVDGECIPGDDETCVNSEIVASLNQQKNGSAKNTLMSIMPLAFLW